MFAFSKRFFSLRNFLLLGGLSKTEDVQRPFVTEQNIIMYLDMVNERVIELKSIAQFVDAQAKIKEGCCKNQLFVYFFEKNIILFSRNFFRLFQEFAKIHFRMPKHWQDLVVKIISYLFILKKVIWFHVIFLFFTGLFVDKKRQPKKMPSCAALLGKAEEEEGKTFFFN